MAVDSETYMAVCGEVQDLRRQLAKSEARAAQMHEAAHELYAWCVENLTAEQIKEGLPAGHKIGQLLEFERSAVEAFILRKQAEAVDEVNRQLTKLSEEAESRLVVTGLALQYAASTAGEEAQRLRRQADEIERAGGEM